MPQTDLFKFCEKFCCPLKNKIRENILLICTKENRNAFLLINCFTFILGGGYLKVNKPVTKVEMCTYRHCENLLPNWQWFCSQDEDNDALQGYHLLEWCFAIWQFLPAKKTSYSLSHQSISMQWLEGVKQKHPSVAGRSGEGHKIALQCR